MFLNARIWSENGGETFRPASMGVKSYVNWLLEVLVVLEVLEVSVVLEVLVGGVSDDRYIY